MRLQAMLMLAQLGEGDERQVADGRGGGLRRLEGSASVGAQRHDLRRGVELRFVEQLSKPALVVTAVVIAGHHSAQQPAGALEEVFHGRGQPGHQVFRGALFVTAQCDSFGF